MFKGNKQIILLTAIVLVVGALVGCAPQQQAAENSGNTQDKNAAAVETVDFEFSQDSDCTICHSVESDSMSDSTCLAGLGSHASMECLTCHEFDSSLEKAHEDVSMGDTPRSSLKRTSVNEDACLSCHDTDELIEKTADITVLTDSEGTVVNPHEVMSIGTGHDEISCSSCHKMHVTSDASQAASDTCLSCHHKEVYKCGTCH
ncbi:cytochrome c3 family protein [Eggerthellaceae bacterium 3-80]|nr:hypothetical protein D7W09_05580 [bacterium D16-34]